MSNTHRRRGRQEIIVVGLGPSAVGLVYGLLSPYAIDDEAYARTSRDHYGGDDASAGRATGPDLSITVLERGERYGRDGNGNGSDGPSVIRDPRKWFAASHLDDAHSTRLSSVPQRGLGGRTVCLPTGRGFGGGTLINATLAVRPSSDDFDRWPMKWREPVGKKGRKRVMDSVLHIESILRSNDALVEPRVHVINGVRQRRWMHDEGEDEDEGTTFHRVSMEQCCSEGPGENPRLRPSPMRFVARYDEESGSHTRVDYYEGILEPFLERNPHLRDCVAFVSGAHVERLIVTRNSELKKNDSCDRDGESVDDWIAEGVEYLHEGQRKTLMANKVVLCAGALYSPALLMASGIGDPNLLREAGIAPLGSNGTCDENRGEWSGVGANLRDHLVTMRLYLTSPFSAFFEGRSVNAVRGWIPLDVAYRDDKGKGDEAKRERAARVGFNIFDGSGFHHMLPYAASVTFYRDVDLGIPALSKVVSSFLKCLSYAISVVLTAMMRVRPLARTVDRCSAMILVGLLDPRSRGRVWIERNSKTCKGREARRMGEVNVLVDPAYLGDDRDLDHIDYSWRALDGLSSRLFPGAAEVLPGPLFPDRRRYAADFSLPYFHWSGSCSMETERRDGYSDAERGRDHVVDEDLKVRNVRGLHVCDASVLPTNVSCNPALLLTAVGFTAASFIVGHDMSPADDLEEKKRK